MHEMGNVCSKASLVHSPAPSPLPSYKKYPPSHHVTLSSTVVFSSIIKHTHTHTHYTAACTKYMYPVEQIENTCTKYVLNQTNKKEQNNTQLSNPLHKNRVSISILLFVLQYLNSVF